LLIFAARNFRFKKDEKAKVKTTIKTNSNNLKATNNNKKINNISIPRALNIILFKKGRKRSYNIINSTKTSNAENIIPNLIIISQAFFRYQIRGVIKLKEIETDEEGGAVSGIPAKKNKTVKIIFKNPLKKVGIKGKQKVNNKNNKNNKNNAKNKEYEK